MYCLCLFHAHTTELHGLLLLLNNAAGGGVWECVCGGGE